MPKKLLENVLGSITVFNAAVAPVLHLVAAIRNPDGTLTAVETLDRADEIFSQNDEQAKAWLDAHPE